MNIHYRLRDCIQSLPYSSSHVGAAIFVDEIAEKTEINAVEKNQTSKRNSSVVFAEGDSGFVF